MDHPGRIERACRRLAEHHLDALLVTDLTNVQYLTGFTGSNGQVILWGSEAIFFSDGRYAARAAELVRGSEVRIYKDRLADELAPILTTKGLGKVGFEAGTVTVAGRDDLAERLAGIELAPCRDVIEGLRRTKEPAEIDLMKRAVALGDSALAAMLDRLRPGMTEREVALELEMYMRTNGAEALSFEPIVGSGPQSAHIHHTPNERVLEKGDLVLLDFGCKVDGYCSDLTRTVVLGPASEQQLESYGLVLEAQRVGIEAVRPGAPGKEVDAVSRAVIEGTGRGEEFGHGLGHGVGLEVHEAPRLHRISRDTLKPGDVVTVEPGVYESSWGGIRIEDCVLVTEEGYEVLGRAPKDELIEI